ncbi:hypothetical protein J1614_011146 [Plenodomus biglobosus]|nr:hypothetical protein J1614_011146 [Plenodomus biglobosus]
MRDERELPLEIVEADETPVLDAGSRLTAEEDDLEVLIASGERELLNVGVEREVLLGITDDDSRVLDLEMLIEDDDLVLLLWP